MTKNTGICYMLHMLHTGICYMLHNMLLLLLLKNIREWHSLTFLVIYQKFPECCAWVFIIFLPVLLVDDPVQRSTRFYLKLHYFVMQLLVLERSIRTLV